MGLQLLATEVVLEAVEHLVDVLLVHLGVVHVVHSVQLRVLPFLQRHHHELVVVVDQGGCLGTDRLVSRSYLLLVHMVLEVVIDRLLQSFQLIFIRRIYRL